jgi:hypothetical protein
LYWLKYIKIETCRTILFYLTAVARKEKKLNVSEEMILTIHLELRGGSERILKKKGTAH